MQNMQSSLASGSNINIVKPIKRQVKVRSRNDFTNNARDTKDTDEGRMERSGAEREGEGGREREGGGGRGREGEGGREREGGGGRGREGEGGRGRGREGHPVKDATDLCSATATDPSSRKVAVSLSLFSAIGLPPGAVRWTTRTAHTLTLPEPLSLSAPGVRSRARCNAGPAACSRPPAQPAWLQMLAATPSGPRLCPRSDADRRET